MTTQTVEARGALTVSDIARFQHFHLLRRVWPVLPLVLMIPPINALLLVTGNTSAAQNILPFSILVLFWLALPQFSARRQYATRRYLAESITYVFDAEGVRLTAPSFSASLKWSVVRNVRETKSLFVLYEAPNLAHILPKRFLSSDGDLTGLRAIAAGGIAPKVIEQPGVIGRWF